MPQFKRTDQFERWLRQLKDRQALARIFHRLDTAEGGNSGDCAAIGEGVSEMRIHYGLSPLFHKNRQDRLSSAAGWR
jgi:putative addiction module killer protein